MCSAVSHRYAEQKFRLKRCGVERIIYLVEGKFSGASYSVDTSALKSAMLECKVGQGNGD